MADLTGVLAELNALGLLGAPATLYELRGVETRLGVSLPSEITDLYSVSNGTCSATPVSRGWVRLWMLSEWRPVRELLKDTKYEAVGAALAFADHCDQSWWYALDLTGARMSIHIVDGLRPPRVVAHSVLQFLDDVLADRRSVYPQDDAALQ
jgi:hypothetical protein